MYSTLQFGIAVFCIAPKTTARWRGVPGAGNPPSRQLVAWGLLPPAACPPLPLRLLLCSALKTARHGRPARPPRRCRRCRELYCRFYDAFESMGEPNIPVDRQAMQAGHAAGHAAGWQAPRSACRAMHGTL